MRRLAAVALLLTATAWAQPKSVLYILHSAGFRHDSLTASAEVLRDVGIRSGKFDVTATEDLTALNDLTRYSAVVFFTSGELALSPQQKQGLLDFVRGGGGFAGFHSATDTLYMWPEYGELIGGRFDGHPWTQEVRIDVEDADHPATAHLTPAFSIVDEIYQFREFSRDRVRVLMTLDTASVGIAPGDYPLAWTRLYGNGRVFYSALGHFNSTWRDPRFQRMLEGAVLWITGQAAGEGQPRPAVQASIAEGGIGNAASMAPAMTVSLGSLVSIFGTNLTTGASMASGLGPVRLGGTRVLVDGRSAELLYASPGQLNVLMPRDLATSGKSLMTVEPAGSPRREVEVKLAAATPGIFVATVSGTSATLWATGLGAVERRGDLEWSLTAPRVSVNGAEARVTFSGMAPGFPGLSQVNVELPFSVTPPFQFELTVAF